MWSKIKELKPKSSITESFSKMTSSGVNLIGNLKNNLVRGKADTEPVEKELQEQGDQAEANGGGGEGKEEEGEVDQPTGGKEAEAAGEDESTGETGAQEKEAGEKPKETESGRGDEGEKQTADAEDKADEGGGIEWQQRVDELEKELVEWRQKAGNWEQEKDRLKTELEKSQKTEKMNQEMISHMETKMLSNLNLISMFQNESQDKSAKCKEAEAKLKTAQEQLARVSKENGDQAKYIETLISERVKEGEGLKAKIKQLESEATQAKRQLEETQSKAGELTSKLKAEESVKNEIKRQMDIMGGQFVDLEIQLKAKQKELDEQAERAKQAQAKLTERIGQLEGEVGAKASESEQGRAERRGLEATLVELQKERGELQGQVRALQKAHDKTESALKLETSRNQTLQKEIAEAEERAKVIESLERQLESARQEMAQRELRFESKKKKFLLKIGEQEKERERMSDELVILEGLKQQKAQLERESEHARAREEMTRAQIGDLRREMGLVIEQKEAIESEHRASRDKQKKMVEKKFITSFLVNFLDVNNSHKIRVEMLETLGSILEFSEDEKSRIGIHRFKFDESKQDGDFVPNTDDKGLTSKFMSFLKG